MKRSITQKNRYQLMRIIALIRERFPLHCQSHYRRFMPLFKPILPFFPTLSLVTVIHPCPIVNTNKAILNLEDNMISPLDTAQLVSVALYSPKPDETVQFFYEMLGMEITH